MLLADGLQRGRCRRIDTVVVAFTDMQGRLMGKRVDAEYFLRSSTPGTVEGCNYLLAAGHGDGPGPGYEMATGSAATATSTRPDLATLRRIPWLEGTALVLSDVAGTTARRWCPRRARC